MRDFVFENKTKVYFGKEQLCHLHEEGHVSVSVY